MIPSIFFAAFAAWFVLGLSPAAAQFDDIWRAGARVQAVASDHENLWAAGAIVAVRGNVRNEIRVAGAEVDIDASAGRDLWAAGAIVTVKGRAARNLYVAGARVSVEAQVGEKLSIAGARVLILPQTEVRGLTRIAGADVVFAGTSLGPAELYGDSVRIDGWIGGDLHVRARSVIVGRSAVINGSTRFETMDEPLIEEGASLRGRQTVTLPWMPTFDTRHTVGALVAVALFAVGAGLVLGLVLLIGARPFVERAIDSMRSRPLRSAFIGLGVLILVPVVAVLLMATIIGIPVGLLTLLAFPLALLTAAVLAAFGVSDWLMNRGRERRSFGGRFGLLLVGLIVLTLLGLIPVLGFVTWLLALLIGLGALWQAMRQRPAMTLEPMRPATPASPASPVGVK